MVYCRGILRRVVAFGFRSARRKAGIFEIAERVIIDGEKTFATFFVENFRRRFEGGRGERFDGARFDGRLRRKTRALSRFRSLGLQG